jgi:serine/threonine protein kinase
MAKLTVGSYIEHYQILEELGKGGMGVVYKALNVNLDKFVAIKTISLGLTAEELITNRFRTEARALAKLQNPNIVSIFDLRVDDNQWFIVMEYVDGCTLSQKIREQETLNWQECVNIFKQILSAIGHAHRAGIIHRDIKPNNIMLNRDGLVKITDFGLAKDQRNLSHTQTSSTGGTLYYMSPEQVKGLQFTDNRSDIYSLGLTFYEMLAGKIPFRKNDTDFTIREAIIKRQFPPPTHFNPAIPVGLNTIVMRAIEKRPEDRFQTVDDMLEAIEYFERNADNQVAEALLDSTPDAFSNIDPANFDISYLSDTLKLETEAPGGQNQVTQISGKRFAVAASITVGLIFIIYFLVRLLTPAAMTELMVVSDPRGASLIVNGDKAGLTPVYNYKVRSGPLNIRLEMDTYITLDTVLTLEPDTINLFSYDLSPAGMIDLSVNPSNARVLINGRTWTGKDLHPIILAEGIYDVQIASDGYQTTRDKLEVKHGDHISRNYDLKTLALPSGRQMAVGGPSSGSEKKISDTVDLMAADHVQKLPAGAVSILTEPTGAEIWLDGYRLPGFSSPCVVSALPPGLHRIELQKDGYEAFSGSVAITPSETTLVQTDMVRNMGDLKVRVKPWGSIYVDGQMVMENSNIVFTGRFGTGPHNLRVVHPTFGRWEQQVELSDRNLLEMEIDFNRFVNVPVTAFDVDGNPVWADIVVDNHETGDVTPKEVALRIGLRTVAAKKEGYVLVNGEKELMVTGDALRPLRFILRKVSSSQAYQP